jgi:hypothetical protein
MNVLGTIWVSFLVFLVVAGIFFGGFFTAQQNNDKVREMTRLCISEGYAGWIVAPDRRRSYDRYTGCVND